MEFEMKCRIGFGFEKPKSVHLWFLSTPVFPNLFRLTATAREKYNLWHPLADS